MGRGSRRFFAGFVAFFAVLLAGCAPSGADGVEEGIEAAVPAVEQAYAEYQQPGLPTNIELVVWISAPGADGMPRDELRDLATEIAGAAWQSASSEPPMISVSITEEEFGDGDERPRFGAMRFAVDGIGFGRDELAELFGPWEKP